MAYRYYREYKKTKPIETKNGVKAQSKRGGFAQEWWAKRWISVLESFDIGARLGRGRIYARKGQVFDLKVDKGFATAKVQGSRPKPYAVEIKISTINSKDWAHIIDILKTKAYYTAKLLAGEMPKDIENVFQEANKSLLPNNASELSTDCSCADWSNPCKHIAAFYYLLAEEFDRNPFIIFKLRGMDQKELLNCLEDADIGNFSKKSPSDAQPQPVPLPHDEIDFWKESIYESPTTGPIYSLAYSASLVKELGKFPFWSGNVPFIETLEELYSKASLASHLETDICKI